MRSNKCITSGKASPRSFQTGFWRMRKILSKKVGTQEFWNMVQSCSLFQMWETRSLMRLGEKTVEGSATGRHVCQVKGFGYLSSLWLSERRTLLGRRSMATTYCPGPHPWRPAWIYWWWETGHRVWREGGLEQFIPQAPNFTLLNTCLRTETQNITTYLEGNRQHSSSLKCEHSDPIISTCEIILWH